MNGTLARGLRLVLALELALYVGAGGWLVARRGWTIATTAGLALAVAIAWRLGFGLAAYAVAWRWGSPTPAGFRLGRVKLALHAATEIGALNAVYSVLQPFEHLWMGEPRPPKPGPKKQNTLNLTYICLILN